MTAAKHAIALPAIVLANDLRTGEIVFLARAGWSADPADALVAHDRATADRFEAEASRAVAANEVVDAALVDVALGADGAPTPNHFRERFKIKGPSNRPDLGKQAIFATANGGARDVPL